MSDGERIIANPWATMLLVVQPDVLGTMLKSTNMRRRGFLQRFLPFGIPDAPYRDRHTMPSIETSIEFAWSNAIVGIWDAAASGAIQVEATGSALQPLRDFEHDRIRPAVRRAQTEHNYLFAGWCSKLAMTSTRIAAVIGQLETPGATTISATSTDAAVGLADAALSHADYLFAHGLQAASIAPPLRVLTWAIATSEGIGGIGGDECGRQTTTRECWQRFKDQAWCDSTDDARHVLTGLTRHGWLKGPTNVTTDKGGRPSEVWAVHPDALKHYVLMTGNDPRINSDEQDTP